MTAKERKVRDLKEEREAVKRDKVHWVKAEREYRRAKKAQRAGLCTAKIVRTPGTCGGRARLDNTRLTVQVIAANFNAGMYFNELAHAFFVPACCAETMYRYYARQKLNVKRKILRGTA
jgi:uncharacterized protein (DUF433 family)